MQKKVNFGLILIIVLLLLVIFFVDESTLWSLYFSYDDTFVINEINTGVREDSIVYNEVSVERGSSNASVSMINNNVDRWVWPTVSNYILTNRFSGGHKALDIASGNGSEIYAANKGVVVTVKGGCRVGNLGCNGRGGNYVVIKHNSNNYYTVYMHLKDIRVAIGQEVGSGQVIGTMGNTGNVYPVPYSSNSTAGTHLHFCLYVGEPYRGGYAINPLSLY